MQWDLGYQGAGLLVVMSLAFGVLAQLLLWDRATRWVWLIASTAFFAVGLMISEVWFGWATVAELQPNIDGLSFDEVLLAFLVGVPLVLVIRFMTRGHRRTGPPSPQS